jgi:hypothetical protein
MTETDQTQSSGASAAVAAARPSAPEPTEQPRETKTLRVVSPLGEHNFRVFNADGTESVVITQTGTAVDAESVDAIYEAAQRSGVTLEEVPNGDR